MNDGSIPSRTPHFAVTQDANTIVVTVTCETTPQQNAASLAPPKVVGEAQAFGFLWSDFYLPLYLPGSVTSNGISCESVNESTSTKASWRVVLQKAVPGTHFAGLEDLQPQILPPEGIEAISRAAQQDDQAMSSSEVGTLDRNDQGAQEVNIKQGQGIRQGTDSGNSGLQALASDMLKRALGSENEARRRKGQPDLLLSHKQDEDDELANGSSLVHARAQSTPSYARKPGPRYGYGFALRFDEPLDPQEVEVSKAYLLQESDPSSVPLHERLKRAWQEEEDRFDAEWYIENLYDPEGEIKSLLTPNYPSPRDMCMPIHPANPAKEPSSAQIQGLLLELLFAFAYDRRVNMNDPTVESGWNIATLCRSLSWLAPTDQPLPDILVGSLRRSLCIPLFRSWKLSLRVLDDVKRILQGGETTVLPTLARIGMRLQEGAQEGRQDALLATLEEVVVAPLVRYCLETTSSAAQDSTPQRRAVMVCSSLKNAMNEPSISELLADDGAKAKAEVGGGSWALAELESAALEDLADGHKGSYV